MSLVLDAAALAGLLASWPVGRLAMIAAGRGRTVGDAGGLRPGAPVRYGLRSTESARPGGPLARLANATADPRAALLLDEYSDDWSQPLVGPRIDGTVRVHRIGPEPEGPAAEAIAALRAKYPQYREVPLFSGPPTLLELAIVRTRGWRASPDGTPWPARTRPGARLTGGSRRARARC